MAVHNLNIFQWNSQSISNKLPELKRFLQDATEQPDILCLQETHLKKEINIPSYHIIYNNRKDSNGGGVLVAIKQGLQYSNVDISNQDMISLTIKLQDKYLDVINIYFPPGQYIDSSVIQKYINKDHHTIIMGDFNAHSTLWGSKQTDSRGHQIENFIDEHNLVVLNNKQPTRLHHTGTLTCIDVTLTNPQMALNSTWSVLEDNLGSDHFPIIINTKKQHTEEPDTSTKYNFKKANWNLFQESCEKDLNSIQQYDDPSVNYNTLLHIIHQNIDKSVPKIKNNKNHPRISVPYWTQNCQNAVNKRKAASKLLRRYKNTASIEIYKKAKVDCKNIIQYEKSQCWQNYCSTLNHDSRLTSVWKMAKK